ncbi:MAG: PHB depolymerase family esterase [Hyphomonadaceae bacterium]
MTRIGLALSAPVFALIASFGAPAHAQHRYDRALTMHVIAVGEEARALGLYVPSSYRAGQPAPLIVALHDRFSSPQALHAISGLAAVAEARGALVLYPEAAEGAWNDGGHAILNRPGPALDDLGFIRAAIDSAAAEYSIDRTRVFLTGIGSGGAMAYALACKSETPFAGVAIVSALMWDFARDQCAGANPTQMLLIHGRRDEYAPVRGGDVPGVTARRLGVDDTLAVWRRVNGCAAATATGRDDSAIYAACDSGAILAYVGVAGGDHDWFHTGDGYELNRQGVEATALIDSFFFERSEFTLPRARATGRRARSWIVYAPWRYDPAQPAPVVVLLHGRPSNAAGMAYMTGMNTVAEENNFIVIYPDGIDNEWNAQFDISASDISLSGRRSTLPQDDVGFLETLTRDLAEDFNIDASRLYLGGFSNGAFMTYRMACSAGDTFAAFAAVSAGLYVELSRYCARSDPTAILIMNGTADPSVPYEGVEVVNPQGGDPIRISLGVQDTVSAFARRNRCSLAGTSTTFAEQGQSPGTHVIRFIPRDCQPGADVAFYLINGGGHTWPGRSRVFSGQGAQDAFGPTNMDMNAGAVIWDFFRAHTLRPAG